jgi:hypothetical protein
MRTTLIIILCFLVLAACKTFKSSIDNSSKLVISSIYPDTCETSFMFEIQIFRMEKQRFPDSVDIQKIAGDLTPKCNNNLDMINSLVYNTDSMDFSYQVNIAGSPHGGNSLFKCYRMIYSQDTLWEMRILHNNNKYETGLIKR